MYEPKKYWDEIGKASKAGKHGSGRFGTNNDGNSLYEILPLESPPKFFKYSYPFVIPTHNTIFSIIKSYYN